MSSADPQRYVQSDDSADNDGSTKAGRQPLLFVSALLLRRLVFARLRTVTDRCLGRFRIALSLCMLFAMLLGNVQANNHAIVVDDDGGVYRAVDGEAVNIGQQYLVDLQMAALPGMITMANTMLRNFCKMFEKNCRLNTDTQHPRQPYGL